MNGWPEDKGRWPAEYLECQRLAYSNPKAHVHIRQNIRMCYNRFTCPTCHITYTVDSSD